MEPVVKPPVDKAEILRLVLENEERQGMTPAKREELRLLLQAKFADGRKK